MYIKVNSAYTENARVVMSARCPQCGKNGTLDPVGPNDVTISPSGHIAGLRACPDPACAALIFFLEDRQGNPPFMYPFDRLDFDHTGVPPSVVGVLQEAITCHSTGSYIAAAIMVRRTLEEICAERGAEGKDLRQRIESLRDKLVLPQELLDGMQELRLLGNDAAHIVSKSYDGIGKDELEVALLLTKEILKAAYQYSSLVARMRSLKKA